MKCYIYKEESKEYETEGEAPIDPLESKKAGKELYILPANATFKEPPAKKEHKAIVWDGDKWTYTPDWRHCELYNPETEEFKTISKIGEEKPAGFYEVKERNKTPYYDINIKEDCVYFVDRPMTTEELTAEAELNRKIAYKNEIDELHARKVRKEILGTWTDQDEVDYIEQVKQLSSSIALRYPYPDE